MAFAFAFQAMPPLLSSVRIEFGASDAELGLLMSVVMVPGIFLSIPAGIAVSKYGLRMLGFLSTILGALGSLTTALANSFPMALLGRLILGIGGAFIIVGTPSIIPQWFSHKDFGKAMGIYATNMPVATIIAFPVATVLNQSFNWRYPFYVGAVAGLLAAVVFVVAIKEGPLRGDRTQTGWAEAKGTIKNGEVWKASFVWMFFNTAAIAFLSWAPTLFQTFRNLEPLYASLLASVLMYAAVVFVPLFGWASDKSGRRRPFMVSGAILLALALNATSYAMGSVLLFSVIALGIAAAMVPPLVMAITADSLPPNLAGTGFSIVTLCQNVGITLSAPLAGYLVQTTESIEQTFFGISLFALAAAVVALTLRTK